MFRWKKDKDKEKEKDDKKKKEKKDRKDRKNTIEKESLTQDELKRLDEVRRSFTSSRSSKDHDDNSEKQSNSSDYSLSSAHDSSPSGSSLTNVDPSKSGSPSRKPPPIPKKPTLLMKPNQGASNIETTPSPQGSTYSMASLHLGTANLTSEMMAFMDQMNHPGAVIESSVMVTPSPAKPSVPSAPPSQVPPGEQGGYGIRWKSYTSNFRLPPVTYLPTTPVRTLTITKRATGDFGFALRLSHSPETESRQTVFFAEPSSLGKTNDTGLLPGDRLLEINNVIVENKAKEEILKLIQSSQDVVLLKVQTVPELRELTKRCQEGSDMLDGTRSGSLSPSGSSKFKTVAKSEEEMEVEKNWLLKDMVWVVHKGGFSAAHLVKTSATPQEGKLFVKLEFSQDVIEVNEEDVEKTNPPYLDFLENVAHLRHVNECSVLHTLRQRYCSQLIYTYAGSNLLVLNPVQPLAAYSEKVMRMFKTCRDDDMPPHIYAVAQTTLNNLLRTRRDQSIVLQGRSGSGKTASFRHLLQYFVAVAGSTKQILTGKKLNAVYTLLEAFGNCRTVMNTNATRFTQLFSVDFDHLGQVVSASLQTYMLERSRVSRRPEGEPNYHIFYYMLAGADEHLRKELYLENLQDPNLFMTPLHKDEDQKRACLSWAYIAAAFQTLSVQEHESKTIWSILGAIYHLGVASACKGSNGRLQFLRPQSAQKAASLLGCSVEDLAKTVFSPDSGPVSGKVSPRSSDGTVEAIECLQAMASGLYIEVFNALIFLINRSLSGSGRCMATIHILDCPGFQNPATCGRIMGAGLEDLCHNYCQERLQSLFHDSTFLTQQERYLQENIEWNKEEFHIASPAPLIDVIDHTPQQGAVRASTADLREAGKRGLLWLLDEESLFPGASEKSFLDKVFTSYSGKDYQQLIRKGPYNHQFTVQHFHGTNPVVYSVTGWLRYSREHASAKQISNLLQESQKDHVSQLFSTSRGVFGASGGNTLHADGSSTLRRSSSMRRAQGVAAAGVKRRSLPLQVKYTIDGLIDLLRRTNVYFIHCFLPRHNAGLGENRVSPVSNKNSLVEGMLNIPLLRSQIRGFQVLDTIRVHKQGFPENIMYSEFRRRFEILAPSEHRIPSPVYDERQAVESLLEHIDIEKTSYRMGLSQIFLRAGSLAVLELKRDQKLNGVITSFQAHCRGYLARSQINKLKVQDMAIRCIQRNVRKFLAIRMWPWWRLYTKVLPLLDVHRTEEELRLKTEELDLTKGKLEKVEKERNELKILNDKLEAKSLSPRCGRAAGRCKCLHISHLKKFSLASAQKIFVMPGSTAEEQSKAKVAESPATNGIFVRPVAVAGIFRPSEDSANKPPALPEKRRFSALSGDLRPVSTGSGDSSNDDFARRRQSWDVKAKEVAFGQNLLRKTPRNSIVSPRTSKQDLASNGSFHEDMSCSDSSSQVSEATPAEKLNSKQPSLPPSNTPTPDSFISVNKVTVTNDSSVKGKVQIVPNASKFTNQLNTKNQNNISIESSVNVVSKNATGSTTVNSVNQISAAEKSATKSNSLEKTPNTVDGVKPPKKVYGLIKRDSKPEVPSLREEHSVNACESKSDLLLAKIEKNVVKKEPQLEIFSKSENVPDKAVANTLDSLKSKSKVYGLNKTNFRNDIGKDSNENKIQDAKLVESNSINKSAENVVISKVPTSISVTGKPPETNTASKTSENKIINKRAEVNILSKSVSKSSEIKELNKPIQNIVSSKTVENKDVNKPFESSAITSKESVVPKSSDSKIALAVSKIADKVSEFQKAQSPPKDVRTVRRTSDVIAAKIQNIFSNISTPDKPPPILAKKSKNQSSAVSSDSCPTNVLEAANVGKLEQITKQKDESLISSSVKNETKLPDESKSQNSDAKNVSKVVTKPIGQEVKITSRRFEGNFNKEECKYIEQATSVADHSSLKKENKVALESRNVLQSCKVEAEVSLVKADSKTEHSINAAASSKAQDKKNLNIGGKMPIKKQDQKSLEGTSSLQATNKDDLKSSNLTAPTKTAFENSNKGSVLKTEIVSTCAASGEKVSKTVTSSNSVTSSINSTLDFKTKYVSKNIESNVSVKECIFSKSTGVSQTSVKTNTVQKSGTLIASCANEITQTSVSNAQKTSQKFINGSRDTFTSNEVSKTEVAKITPSVKTSTVQKTGTLITSCGNEITQTSVSNALTTSQKFMNSSKDISQPHEVSKIEVAKITPSTVPCVVPTVNVLFRTKSPQSSASKEENRKKVIVETYSGSSPVPPAVINASKISDSISSSACDSVQEALKTVENVQKSLNSPKLPSKNVNINLKKEELTVVSVGPINSSTAENSMPPNAATKISDKCSSIESNNSKIETISTAEKNSVTPAIVSEAEKDEPASKIASLNSISSKDVNSNFSEKCEIGNKVELKHRLPRHFFKSDSTSGIDDMEKKYLAMDRYSISGPNVNVVDLNDWSKKFQLSETEPPRAPVRRRTGRESMPPTLPNRSRFGSLKRMDDSSKYIARSPSHSSLPQRYSYTEMLSKVCSMGVLPYTESALSKSSSSVSSQVSELWSELSEEQSNASHTAEMLESETTERMRLEKEMQDLQNRCSQVQLRSDKMEMEIMESRVYRTPELNGDLSEDEDVEANSSLYKQKYERAVRDMEIMKRRMQQQHEEEIEQKAMMKKASDKRLAEALEDVEEERQVANQWKRKAQKLGSELQDLRLMLEEQMARNGELEKKQRRFDAELSAAQEEIKKERLLREKFAREKDQSVHEKYSLEQDLQSCKLDNDTLHEKITQLNRELDELSLSSKGEEEVTQLKRAKQELERKSRDQEEELEELAAQVGMLEQAKLRLEMSLEKVRQEHRREASVREEEIEEIRASFSKKIKNLEAQLETEQDERHQLMKQKHELERRIYEMADQPPPQDPEVERRLRRDLKRTKALLRDAQSMLEHTREGQTGKTLIRQLKNQLEDSEFAKATAVKARQAVEAELHDCQTQLEEATRVKNEAESRCLQLSREKSAIQTQLEEAEEEMAEVMKKYKAVVAQMSIDQKALSEQNQQIADLETEKQMLKDQLSEVSHKFEHLAGQSEDTHKVHRLDGKVRDLESKLELEQTTRSRLEHQIARLKEQNERAREECESLRNKELQAQEGVRRLQRQMRDLREDYAALQQKEAEAYRKQHELEMALENTETDLQVTKNDLRLACQRIQDLQNALEDDLDSGTDVPDDSGSDSDDSFELSMLRNQSITPTQRCDSAGSNYSLASEGFRSRTSSFTRELSAFSSRDDDAESKNLNGLSGLNTASRLPDVDHVEPV